MRLWTLHPRYLDTKGLVAAWREGLLAQKVLAGKTKGYRRHPQLIRFLTLPDPLGGIASFLRGLAEEARRRGYRFDVRRISRARFEGCIAETRGQLQYEWAHLRGKLQTRAPEIWRRLNGLRQPKAHPLFRIVPGAVKEWER